MRPTLRPISRRGGFTLVELLVVIVIIGLISATALPVVLPALNERRVSEGARVVQAVLAGTRDAAIRANAPRGVRLLPDPLFNFTGNAGGGALASNRFVAIEPAPPYGEGAVNGYVPPLTAGSYAPSLGETGYQLVGSFAPYPPNYLYDLNYNRAQYLRVQSNEIALVSGVPVPQVPTGWQFNIRQGDKIRFNDSGAYYTVAGPIHGKPIAANPERYICYKSIGGNDSETILYGDGVSRLNSSFALEYLNLTNGIDDDGDGWIDESCDGIDNDGDGIIDPGNNGIDDDNNGVIDEPEELLFGLVSSGTNAGTFSKFAGSEYEVEKYIGVLAGSPPSNLDYTIVRRPVVSPNAIETTLPEGVVIDLTTWNAPAAVNSAGNPLPPPGLLPERSRLPVDPFSGYVDIMIDQTGRVVPPTAGGGSNAFAANSSLASIPFYHFWLTERDDVVAPLFGTASRTITLQQTTGATPTAPVVVPKASSNYGNSTTPQNYLLPMPKEYGTVDVNGQPAMLKAQRRLVTVFTKTGQIVANSIETFNVNDTSAPYYDAQNGTKESL